MQKTFIIAEAGVCHNGNIDTALRMVDAAKEAGCDSCKFQTFWGFPKYKHLELTRDEFRRLKEYCDNVGIEFMSTPDTIEVIEFLAYLGMWHWKIGSRNAGNHKFLQELHEANCFHADLAWKIYLSTGMCSREEVAVAMDIISVDVILHCVSAYPAPYETVNLSAMLNLVYDKFHPRLPGGGTWKFGLSDHTLGIHIPIAAVAMGASVIEKHFTLDKNMEGPDHAMSLDPKELKEMVRCIRDVELAMGDGVKRPTEYELKVRDAMRNYEDCR